MKILALDLGTSTGWAFWDGISERAGTWNLASGKNLRHAKKLRMDRRLDIRVSALWNRLEEHAGLGAEWVVFEDVKFAHSQAQSHLWGSFRGAVWAFAHCRGLEIDCLDTGKLKKFATGSGAATKEQMLAFGKSRFPGEFDTLGDDAVDALWLLKWALTILR